MRDVPSRSRAALAAALLSLALLAGACLAAAPADARPVILPNPSLKADRGALIEVVAPKAARRCWVSFRGAARGYGPYRVSIGGPTRFVRWNVPRSALGTWRARFSCRGRRGTRLGTASRRLTVGRAGPARGRIVFAGSVRSGRGSIPELRPGAVTATDDPSGNNEVDTTLGNGDPSKFTRCDNGFWVHSTRTTGDGIGTLAQIVPTQAARKSTLGSSQENDPTYRAIWKEVEKCSRIGKGMTDPQRHSMYMQLACHARYGITSWKGGNTWDLEAWRKDVPWSQGLSIGGECGENYGDAYGGARYVRGRIINSFPSWDGAYPYDNPDQRAAWLVDDSLNKRHITTIGAYNCLLASGKAKASWFPRDFLTTYLKGDGPDLADAEACGAGQQGGTQTPSTGAAPRLAISGSCTTTGGTLTSSSSGFTPGGTATISAWYPDGREYTNLARTSRVRADGSIGWVWPCAGDPAGTYKTEATDDATGRVTGRVPFTIGPAPSIQTPPIATTRQLVIDNRVTNGPTAMREDTPAYLSTVTRNFCKRDGCALPGTEMGSGATIVAECTLAGNRTTNGQDNSAIDDGNPGLFTSTRWYGIRWGDGRFGYLSEVWARADFRGGLGLRGC